MMNVLIVLYNFLISEFGLAIIALTIIVNLALFPLTSKQLRSTQKMQALQPKMAELQKKYARDKQRLAQEQMRLYRESGMSPTGCIIPLIVQVPVWIALYQSIIRLLGVTPEDFLSLSQLLYSWPIVHSVLPLDSTFLWLNLGAPDQTFVLAILVGLTMWFQQRQLTVQSADPRQQAQARMMQWMMPLMFAFLALSFPSGLALFWVASGIFRIVSQYLITGRGSRMDTKVSAPLERDKKLKRRIEQSVGGDKKEQ
jgi:YidC/Oxa1 family membrane protein insertase